MSDKIVFLVTHSAALTQSDRSILVQDQIYTIQHNSAVNTSTTSTSMQITPMIKGKRKAKYLIHVLQAVGIRVQSAGPALFKIWPVPATLFYYDNDSSETKFKAMRVSIRRLRSLCRLFCVIIVTNDAKQCGAGLHRHAP